MQTLQNANSVRSELRVHEILFNKKFQIEKP